MPETSCIFCRIARGELPAEVVHRAEGLLAIRDIAPKAPVHVLCFPERHLATFREISVLDSIEGKRLLDFVAETAEVAGLVDYRVIVNVGPEAGQTVYHLHWHVLGGRTLPFP
ncbi:MAG: HIT domain-containing protein [Thermoleophilia bacterium]|nr:HIT domain-containing protein [Thermoleophilia bacterium]